VKLDKIMSDRIVSVAVNHIGRPFDRNDFCCVHFVADVYDSVGIEIPKLDRMGFPPSRLHLSEDEFKEMPIGHSAFFRRKASLSKRHWTHVALVYSDTELIHCSLHIDGCVTITPKDEFLDVYALTPKPL
jgi:hypothetical protein